MLRLVLVTALIGHALGGGASEQGHNEVRHVSIELVGGAVKLGTERRSHHGLVQHTVTHAMKSRRSCSGRALLLFVEGAAGCVEQYVAFLDTTGYDGRKGLE